MKSIHKYLIAVGVLAVISPVGIYLPEIFKASSAWGEWDSDQLKELTGYIPEGIKALSHKWKALMPDYSFYGWEKAGIVHHSFAYIIAALLGISICLIATYLIGKLISRKGS